jgi:hypothetical protein
MGTFVQNEKNLQTIRIQKSEIKNIVFTDDGKEISYKGEMYDIKDRSLEGDCIVFHCLNDKKEKVLLADLDKLIQNNIDTKSPSGEKQNNVSKNILKDYFASGKPTISLSSVHVGYPAALCPLPSAIPLSLSAPPPEQA